MKKLSFTMFLLTTVVLLNAQPSAFKYQTVVRNSTGENLSNQNISLRMSIIQGELPGTLVYAETHLATTNEFGLLTIEVGRGTPTIGDFETINWNTTPCFMKTEIDPTGGYDFVDLGTSELLSVPFSLYSKSSYSSYWSKVGSSIFYNDGKVGIGTESPSGDLSVVGNDSVRVIISPTEGANNLNSGILLRSTFGGDIPDYEPRNLALIKAHFDGGAWGNAALSFNIAGDDCMTDGDTDPCERMRINALGNLGIGTSSPENRLHIVAESDPMRLEGLQPTSTLNTYLVADENGVVYKRSGGGSGTASWELTGNSGTSADIHFIGTTDNAPLTIKVNNQIAGKIDHVLYNSSLGYGSLALNTTGYNNSALGHSALNKNTTGYENTAVGKSALYSNTLGYYNSAFGRSALHSNTTGYSNNAFGVYSMFANTTGVENIALGLASLYYNTTGSRNTASGHASMYFNTTGSDNTASGYSSLYANTSGNRNSAYGTWAMRNNTTGFSNVAVGASALFNNTVKSNLIAIGDSALFNNGIGATSSTHASNNVAIGSKALYSNTTGSENIGLGFKALYSNINGNNNTVLGNNALESNTNGGCNTAVGYNALNENSGGNYNTAVGHYALKGNTNGNNNIAIGYFAGSNQNESNQLIIDNIFRFMSNPQQDAIIYGHFSDPTSLQTLRFNAQVNIKHSLTANNGLNVTGNVNITGSTVIEGGATIHGGLGSYGNIYVFDGNTNEVVVALGTGLDYAEGFDVSETESIGPGTVLCIDPEHQGKLKVSSDAYDFRVAGIVAGAKGLGSGVKLGSEQYDQDVALAGRVYCNVIATDQDIVPGDLLTTSDVPGFAMKVKEFDKARGAILGKAMENLEKGKKGQILVLVTLQ